MPDPRLLIDAPLAAGVRLDLSEDQAGHVTRVLRLGVGAGLRVFNARDGEWRAHIETVTKRGATAAVDSLLRPARACADLDLLFAPVKRAATDLIVEKATELGVRRMFPVITARTIAETVRLDRLSLIARAAAEQTERFDAPEICAPLSLEKILDGWEGARTLIFADEAGEAAPIAEALNAVAPPPFTGEVAAQRPEGAMRPAPLSHPASRADSSPVNGGAEALALLIGPEGGFDPTERRMLRALPYVTPVSLGPRILRAETAAIAALAVIQALWGDWRAE